MMVLSDLLPVKFDKRFLGVAMAPTLSEFNDEKVLEDASTGQDITSKHRCVCSINDMRALSACTGNMQHPAKTGLCHTCQCTGITSGGTTIVACAVCHLPADHELRQKFFEAFPGDPVLQALAFKRKPPLKTHALVERWAAQTAASPASALPSHGQKHIDAVSPTISGYDSVKQNFNCVSAHSIACVIRDLIDLWKGKKGGSNFMTPARLASEEKYGRLDLMMQHPWQATPAGQRQVHHVARKLRLWMGSEVVRSICVDKGSMKITDLLLLCGPIGAYLVTFMGLPQEYEELFIDLLFALEPFAHHQHRELDIPLIHMDLVVVLTKCEIMLPLCLATISRHVPLHTFEDGGAVGRLGSASLLSMLGEERFNKLVKKLSHSSKNVAVGVARMYSVMEDIQRNRLDWPEVFPTKSNVATGGTLDTFDPPAWATTGLPAVVKYGNQGMTQYTAVEGSPISDGLLSLWISTSEVFRDSVGRYMTYVRAHKRKRKRGQNPPLPMGSWATSGLPGARRLSPYQATLLGWTALITEAPRVTLDGILFRTVSVEEDLKTRNSGVVYDFEGTLAYGMILDIFQNDLGRGAQHVDQRIDAIRVEWFTVVGRAFGGRVPVVKQDENHPWNNGGSAVADLRSARRYNVVFWKRPRHDGEFVVIARPAGRMYKERY
jgi:hypothetical protein